MKCSRCFATWATADSRHYGGQRHCRLSAPMAGYSPTIRISTTTGGRTFSSRAATSIAAVYGPRIGRAAQYGLPESRWREVRGADRGGGLTRQPPGRHRGSAIGDLNGDGRLDVVVTALSAPAEIWINDSRTGITGSSFNSRHQEQPRRDRRTDQASSGGKAQYNHVALRRLRFVQRRAGAFRLGPVAAAESVEIRWPSASCSATARRAGRSPGQD